MIDSTKKTELETSNQIHSLQLKAVDLFPSFFFRARVSPLGGQQIGPIEASCSDQAIASELIAAVELENIWEIGMTLWRPSDSNHWKREWFLPRPGVVLPYAREQTNKTEKKIIVM